MVQWKLGSWKMRLVSNQLPFSTEPWEVAGYFVLTTRKSSKLLLDSHFISSGVFHSSQSRHGLTAVQVTSDQWRFGERNATKGWRFAGKFRPPKKSSKRWRPENHLGHVKNLNWKSSLKRGWFDWLIHICSTLCTLKSITATVTGIRYPCLTTVFAHIPQRPHLKVPVD